MTTLEAAAAPQTPAQWAVRWFAVIAIGGLFASAPLAHLVWHGLLGRDESLLPLRTQTKAPTPAIAAALDGSWMAQLEKHLREDAPATFWLRANWNELRYRLGVPRGNDVRVGRDEWLFLDYATRIDFAAWQRSAPARRAFLAGVRDQVKAAGAELVIALVPDKERVHAEKWAPDGVLPAAKAGCYAAGLAEFAELGIPAVDLAAAMAAARAADPTAPLYYRGDTHWRKEGALAAGAATAAFLEARYGEALGPRTPMALSGVTATRLVGDITANLGLAVVDVPDPASALGLRRPVPLSLLADRLAETREYYGVELSTPTGRIGMDGKDDTASVWLIGTSFAHDNGANAVALHLGRSIRTTVVIGASGLEAMSEARPAIRPGQRAKVVLWEIVERSYFSAEWWAPKR